MKLTRALDKVNLPAEISGSRFRQNPRRFLPRQKIISNSFPHTNSPNPRSRPSNSRESIDEKGDKMATSMLQPGIFNNPRPKRNLLPNPNKKRKTEHNVEEISFDDNARADYLTGFHKRKVERAKRAKAEAEKKMREERVGMRKQVRSTFFLSILRFFVNAILARWVLILVGNS